LDFNVLDSYTQELRGDALFAAGSYSDALAAYIAASQAPHIGDGIQLDIKTAQTRVELPRTITSKRRRRISPGRYIRNSVKTMRHTPDFTSPSKIIRFRTTRI